MLTDVATSVGTGNWVIIGHGGSGSIRRRAPTRSTKDNISVVLGQTMTGSQELRCGRGEAVRRRIAGIVNGLPLPLVKLARLSAESWRHLHR